MSLSLAVSQTAYNVVLSCGQFGELRGSCVEAHLFAGLSRSLSPVSFVPGPGKEFACLCVLVVPNKRVAIFRF